MKYRIAGPENTRSKRSVGNGPAVRCYFSEISESEEFYERSPDLGKSNLTLEEAAAYSGIGINKLRQMTDDENCEFVLWIGNKRLIKRRKLDEYIEKMYSV